MSGKPNTNIVLSIPSPRVLLVDDDQMFLEAIRHYLSSQGYVVDTATMPESATRLLQESSAKYHLVIADLNFGKLSLTTGDEFLLQNRPLFSDAAAVVISGASDLTPERLQQLREAGIHFLQKSPVIGVRLKEIAGETREKLDNEIASILSEDVIPRVKELTGSEPSIAFGHTAMSSAGSKLTDLFKGVIIGWLRDVTNLDTPTFAYDNKIFSANELITEIQAETEVGLAHVRLLLSEFESFLEDLDGDA